MFNDDRTSMSFVKRMLVEIFGAKSKKAANIVMLQIHKEGSAVVGLYPFDVAEAKVAQVHDSAQNSGFPLECRIEKSPEEHIEPIENAVEAANAFENEATTTSATRTKKQNKLVEHYQIMISHRYILLTHTAEHCQTLVIDPFRFGTTSFARTSRYTNHIPVTERLIRELPGGTSLLNNFGML